MGLGMAVAFALGLAGGALLFRAGPTRALPKPAPVAVEVPDEIPDPGPWFVRRVIDGDTFEVAGPGGVRVRIRLRRTNAPEMDEPGGPEAKAALEAKIGGKRIHLKSYARDRYGRTIAEVAAGEAASTRQ